MTRPSTPAHRAVSALCLLTAIAAASFTKTAGAASLPSITIAATAPNAAMDGSATGLLTFSRSGDTTSAVTVNFALGGTAVKWTDYYRLPQGDMPVAVTIPAGTASATLAITAKANSTGAIPESATFTLSADPTYSVGSPAKATITIVSAAEATPTVNVVATAPTAAIGGSASGLLTFSRTGGTANSLTINYLLTGSAVKWTDYYRLPQGDMPVAVTIPAGAASATLPITAKANSTGASPETAVFTLAPDPSYSVGTGSTATITITSAGTPVATPAIVNPRRGCASSAGQPPP